MQEWSQAEILLLEKNINQPIKAIYELFIKAGYNRSPKAISRKKEKLSCSSTTVSFSKVKDVETGATSTVLTIATDGDGDDIIQELYNTYDKELSKKAVNEPRIAKGSKGIQVYRSPSKNQRYVHLCDLHIPFQVDEIGEIIEKEKSKDTILIINGDFLDCFDVSVYPKAYSVGLKNEVNQAKAYLKDWSKKFKAIYIIQGNHEHRLSTFLRKKISADVVSIMTDDIIEIILNDLKIDNIHYRKGDTNNWYIQVDNVIIAHPVDFKGSILATSLMVMNYFDARNASANVFMIGHTHALGKAVYKGRTLVEGGCLCKEQDYAASGKLNYMPQTNSYITFTSKNGIVGFNDIELVVI